MNRRDALKVLGLGTLAPSLFVEKRKIVGRRFEGERIPTGFRLIDAAMGGGMRLGEVCTIYGDAPTPLLHSIAINMGEHASVALVTRQPYLDEGGYNSYDGTVSVFRASIPHHYFPGRQWDFITKAHDVVVMDGDHISHQRCAFLKMAQKNGCLFLCGHYPFPPKALQPLYRSNYIICVEDQRFPVIGYSHMGRLYSAALVKNRYGPRCVSPIIFYKGRFISVEEAPYWECTSQEVCASIILSAQGCVTTTLSHCLSHGDVQTHEIRNRSRRNSTPPRAITSYQ